MITTEKRYLTCAETAKLVRKALAREFPGQKFSVRSHVYSGGASIDVDWTDGPTAKTVDAVVADFSGAGFDGMIDLKYYVTTWLAKDGTVRLAHSPGTESSRGSVPAFDDEPMYKECELVHMGADYVFTHWDHSPAAVAAVEATASPHEYQDYSDQYGAGHDGQFVHQVFWTPERYPVTAYRAGLIDADSAAKAGGWMRKDGTQDENGRDNYEYDVEAFVAYANRRSAA